MNGKEEINCKSQTDEINITAHNKSHMDTQNTTLINLSERSHSIHLIGTAYSVSIRKTTVVSQQIIKEPNDNEAGSTG